MISVHPGRIIVGTLIAVAAVLPSAALGAAGPPDMKGLFPNRAEIIAHQAGLSRLLLPPEVLAECQPDLSDLRVIDRWGREVPYIVDGGPPPDQILEELVTFQPQLLSASRQTEERDSAPNLQRETFHLSLPVTESRRWDLVMASRQSRFVRRFEVMAVKDGEDGVVVAEGSLFRLQGPLRERLRATLPIVDASYLAVTLEGEGDSFLAPTFRLEASRVLAEGEQARVVLAIRKSHSAEGRTVVELERPRGLVPDQLVVTTATGSFNRRFEVWDQGSGSADTALGSATLYRLDGVADVERSKLALQAARGDGLRVIIEDGDSPPLEELVFEAAFRRPSLVFSLAGTGPGETTGTLLFGGARAFRPRYDLAGLLTVDGRNLVDEEARINVALRDPTGLGLARLGPPGANPLWNPEPALAFAMRPGTEIATWKYGYRRPLSVPVTEEGLLRLTLDAETVANCRQDLADVRLVDSESRQWPYLLDRAGSAARLPLSVRGPETDQGKSSYHLELPARPLPLEELLLDGPAPYFDRPFELQGALPGRAERWRRLARGRLTRRPEDPRELAVSIGGGAIEALELQIEDGDDAALEWSSVEARVSLPELFFAAPEGEYTLLFGDPDAKRPRYELERVRDLILAVDSTVIQAGDLVEAPDRGPFSRFRGDGGWQQILLWAALVLAALALAWITLRLARQDPEAG